MRTWLYMSSFMASLIWIWVICRTCPLFVSVAEALWGVKDKQPHLGLVLIEGMFGLVQETKRKWDMSGKPCYSIVWRGTFWVPEEIDLASKLKTKGPSEWSRQQQVAPEIKESRKPNQIAITTLPLNRFLCLFLVSENCWRHWYVGDFLCSCSGLLIGKQCFSPHGLDLALRIRQSVSAPAVVKWT